MAKFEKTHARKKFHCHVELLGNALSLHEWGGDESRLKGYCFFSTPEMAKNELEKLISTRISEGYDASDEEARKLMGGLVPAAGPSKDASRMDFAIYNESNGFTIHNSKVAGKNVDDGSKKWKAHIKDGNLLPITLVQDDPFIVRVLIDTALSEEEEASWVGKQEAELCILPDGELYLAAGAEHIYGGNEEVESFSEYIQILKLKPGNYKATLYTLFPGLNSATCLDTIAGGYNKAEPAGSWFRRTRPDTPFPDWLAEWCRLDPNVDPVNKAEWKKAGSSEEQKSFQLLDFLLQLETLPKTQKPENVPPKEDSWYESPSILRKPELCPLGISAVNPKSNQNKQTLKWIYPVDLSPLLEPFEAKALAPNPCTLSCADLSLLYVLAKFCDTLAVPELRIDCAYETVKAALGDLPEHVVLVPDENGGCRVCFSLDITVKDMETHLTNIGKQLDKLPPETKIELICASTQQHEESKAIPGTQRYQGKLRTNKDLEITHTYPPLNSKILTDALELAKEGITQEELKVTDEAEGQAVIKYAMNAFDYHFEEVKPVLKGNKIALSKPDASRFRFIAASAFFHRYRNSWPIDDRLEDDDKEED